MLGTLMIRPPARARIAAFTLIEAMIVIALVAIVVSLAGPSFRDYILMQRLRSTQTQLVTDLNYARSESVSRSVVVQVRFETAADQSCYIIYTRNDSGTTAPCTCTAEPRCPITSAEVKTVRALVSEGVGYWQSATQTNYLTISPRTGAPDAPPLSEGVPSPDFTVEARLIDASRRLRVAMSSGGRVQVCSPSATVSGAPAC